MYKKRKSIDEETRMIKHTQVLMKIEKNEKQLNKRFIDNQAFNQYR